MAYPLPVWLAVQEELLGYGGPDCGGSCFDEFDDEALFETFHLSRPCLTFITDTIGTRMKKVALKIPSVSVDAMVMVGLNYFAHGVSSSAVLQRAELSMTDSTELISTVSGVIAGMSEQFISFPQSQEAKAGVASKTQRFCGIPNVLGVLAPAHFKIRASPYEKDQFRSFVNTLGFTSVVSQVICDSDGNILSVEKCCVGSALEQEMWDSSSKGKEMEEDLHGPYWVIGGNGYRLSKHVLTPVSEPAHNAETRFNEAHAQIHNVMRATLGSMKSRFRCLMQLGFTNEDSLDKKSNIITACSVLHNIAKKFSVPPPPTTAKNEQLHPSKQRSAPGEIQPEALRARQELVHGTFSRVSSSEDTKSKSVPEEEE